MVTTFQQQEPAPRVALAAAVALMVHYFDIQETDAWTVVLGLSAYNPPSWIRIAVIEALYQGRYKAISVEQILSIWRRRGKILSHFNREFEAIVTVPLPDRVQAQLRALAREHQLEHRQQYKNQTQNQTQNQNQNQNQNQTQKQTQRQDQPQRIQPARTYQKPQSQNPQSQNLQLPNPQAQNPQPQPSQARPPQAQDLHPYPEPSLDLSPSAQPPESQTILQNATLPRPIVASLGSDPGESEVLGGEESLESNSLGENSLESEDTPGGDRLPSDSLPSSSLGDAVPGNRAPTLRTEAETIEEEATPRNAPLPGMAKLPSLPKLSQLAKILNFNPANIAVVEAEEKTRLEPEIPLETSSDPIPDGIPDATSALALEPTIAEADLEFSREEPKLLQEPKLPAPLLTESRWSPAVRRSSSQIDQFCPTPDRSGFDRKLLALANQS